MRALALFLGRHAARVIDPVRPQQAAAMYAEIENLDDREALSWAIGCVAAAYRQRASILAIAVLSARLCVAAAAAAFGLLHVVTGSGNLWLKIALLNGQAVPIPQSHIDALNGLPLNHWLLNFVVFGVLGVLHIFAALMMVTGSNARLLRAALLIVCVDVALPVIGTGGFTFPAMYVALITLMAATSFALAWIWRWDEHRLARDA